MKTRPRQQLPFPLWIRIQSPVRVAAVMVACGLEYAVCGVAGAAAHPGRVGQSPFAQVQVVPVGEVRWTGGFWGERFASCRDQMVPHMWELMEGSRYKPFLGHFKIAAGLAEGRYRGAKWNDGDFYKFLEAACSVLAVTGDPEWDQRLDRVIDVIGNAQRADGYLHTPVLIGARNGDPDARPFSDRFDFEMYNMGHLMTAACVHHEVTGKENFLAVARKAADFLDGAFRDTGADGARHAVCPSHFMGIVDLYRATGEGRYLDLAQRLFRMRALAEGGGDDNQDRVPFAQQTEAVGHAVRANYLYAGAADLFLETGDRDLWAPLAPIWQNVVTKKMYITGGCGALYDGASPDGSEDQGVITRTHQAYGRNYQLPNTTAHAETCANIGNVLWNWRMFLATGEAKYIDVAELALYNSVLSGVGLGGVEYFYVNPLRQLETLPTDLRWSRSRVPFVTSFCCPPNLVRTVAGVGGYAYAKSEGTLWVNLYGSNSLSTELPGAGEVEVEQVTEFPWDGAVRLVVRRCGDRPFALRFRVPGWAAGAGLSVNGEEPEIAGAAPGSYAEVRRVWAPGDTVELSLAMPPQLIEAHPLVEENRNQVAVKRGPVVYCLESHELPEGAGVHDVAVPVDADLEARFEAGLLGGVGTVEVEAVLRRAGGWDGRLYRVLDTGRGGEGHERTPVRFIPYFAWANRGPSEMSVWLPLER